MSTAVFPGSFDPMTLGHADIIRRASLIFDTVYVAVVPNSAKNPLFSPESRAAFIKEEVYGMSNVCVEVFDGLVTDFCAQKDAGVIIKGVRRIADFEEERQMAEVNSHLSAGCVETLLIFSPPPLAFISSGVVREYLRYKKSLAGLVPDAALPFIEREYKNINGEVR